MYFLLNQTKCLTTIVVCPNRVAVRLRTDSVGRTDIVAPLGPLQQSRGTVSDLHLPQMLITEEVGRARRRERGKGGRAKVKLFLVEETLIYSGAAGRETDLKG